MSPPAFRRVTLPETDSTNAEAMRRALAGERGPLWVLAERQTLGRGRAGRTWTSEPGNLHASYLVTFEAEIARAGELSLIAGLAAYDAIRRAASGAGLDGLRLKWPNDVLVGGAKTGGILVECSTIPGSRGFFAVIGIGLNLVSHPSGLDRPATDLAEHGILVSPHVLVARVAETLDHWLGVWSHGVGFPAVRTAWSERAGQLGEPLSVKTAEGPVTGYFAGIDARGALLLKDDRGQIRSFTYGDVQLGSERATTT